MDLQMCTNELMGLADISERMKILQKARRDFAEESSIWRTNKAFFEECAKTVDELENERKEHAEELRQINQDINLLEDMLKNLHSTTNMKREELSRKARILRHEMTLLNRYIELCGDESLQPLVFDEDFDASLKQLLRPFPLPMPVIPPGFLPKWPLSFISNSKMKNCEACGGQIHRNAPTCPLCKSRTVSRNPKRKRKDQQNF
ncbi:unnamed protein product, partial [Mesorhabditis belari]|uniref:C4H2-type domain-containing protein n=1 Tax=Mesorhabditis belari TaxID=2138241 RepID=A0AAF3ETH1_9BILA